MRGDDAAGLEAVRRLHDEGGLDGDVELILHDTDGVDLIERWRGARAVVILDAVRSGAPPGTVHRFVAAANPLPAALAPASSHAIGVAEGIELARALDRLPAALIVYGVEGERFDTGTGLSETVRAALGPLTSAVRRETRALSLALEAGRSR